MPRLVTVTRIHRTWELFPINPGAKKIPGLRSYVISNGPVQALAGSAPHLVAILHFYSLAGLTAALASPEGQAAAADLSNFASAGATLLLYDSKAV
jgi:uncharacterized protein (TIGR02118 family)